MGGLKMKKSIIIILLAMTFGLVGCTSSTKETIGNEPTAATTETKDKSNTTEQTSSNNGEKTTSNNQDNSSSSNKNNPTSSNKDKTSASNEVSSNTKNNNSNQVSKKQEYRAKLDKIDLELKGSRLYEATTNDMYQGVCKEHKQWDDMLNEIYGVLKLQLSQSDMKKLQSEELQWIKDRDNKAKKDAQEWLVALWKKFYL